MSDSLIPFERPSSTFGAQSVDTLRELVLRGRLPAGARVNEAEIADSLGISRGPLREAIRQLVGEGLLVSVSHKGAFVKEFSATELRELYQLRIAIETRAIKLLGTAVGLEPLDESLSVTSSLIAENNPSYKMDLGFHSGLVALTGNSFLIKAAQEVHQQIVLAGSMYGYDSERSAKALHDHQRVTELVRAGDLTAAADALEQHLLRSLERAVTALGNHQGQSAAGKS